MVFYSAAMLTLLHEVALRFASDVKYSPDDTLIALGSWKSGLLMEQHVEEQKHW